jgi:hypothetical protein
VYRFVAGKTASVEISGDDANGNVHIDAVNVVPAP